jgi:hypothetical protein
MSTIFCCPGAKPYKNRAISEESKFRNFITWAESINESEVHSDDLPTPISVSFAVRVIRQVNFGPLESKRYFIHSGENSGDKAFVEVTEQWLIDANFQKLNAQVDSFFCGVKMC